MTGAAEASDGCSLLAPKNMGPVRTRSSSDTVTPSTCTEPCDQGPMR